MEMENYTGTEENEEFQGAEDYRIILCGASAYDKKYYFNEKFDKLPESIKEELHIICVLFTEEAGGIFTVGFTPLGDVELDTRADEGDLLYDAIGGALMVKKIRSAKREMLEALSLYFKITFLHQNPGSLLEESEEESTEHD